MSSAVGARPRGVLTALDYQGPEEQRHAGLRAVRAVRHRTANALQVAFGWAQLGEEGKARDCLERMVREEALLSALGRSGDDAQQHALWQLMADAEEAGQALAFRGEPRTVRPGMLRDVVAQLGGAIGERRAGTLVIACGEDGVTVSRAEEAQDVRR